MEYFHLTPKAPRGHNNAGDALRHAEWSANMAQALGADEAKKIADAHEVSNPNEPNEQAMDLINNNVGRVLGEALPGTQPEDIARLALKYGLLQTSVPSGGKFFFAVK